MTSRVRRRHVLSTLLAVPLLLPLAGCGGGPSVPSGVRTAGRVVVAIAKKLVKIGPIAIDWADLALEIKAIIDGKEETIVAHITREEADTLRNGGQLVIKGDDGAELPVEYRAK